MQTQPELIADYKHLCSPTVPFTKFLFGDDSDLSKQLKDLAEATKVSNKIGKNESKQESYKGHSYNKPFKPQFKLKGTQPLGPQKQGGGEEAKLGPADPSKAINKVPIMGRLNEFVPACHEITSDPEVLDWVQHCHVEFINDSEPVQFDGHRVTRFNPSELPIIYY